MRPGFAGSYGPFNPELRVTREVTPESRVTREVTP